MARTTRARRVQRYSLAFRQAAVRLSDTRGVLIKDVAEGLDIHPFMLSRWRREAREGTMRADPPVKARPAHEQRARSPSPGAVHALAAMQIESRAPSVRANCGVA